MAIITDRISVSTNDSDGDRDEEKKEEGRRSELCLEVSYLRNSTETLSITYLHLTL